MRSGRSRPACSARSQPVLRATPDSKPSRKAPAVSRVSALPNTGPIRSFKAASSRSHATSEPDQTATDIDSLPDLTCPGEGHILDTDATVVLGVGFEGLAQIVGELDRSAPAQVEQNGDHLGGRRAMLGLEHRPG